VLEYVRTQDMAAYVRKTRKPRGIVPAWAGSKMPLSSELADAVLELLHEAADGDFSAPEMAAAMPMLQTQARLSRMPRPGRLLVESYRSNEGHHLFVYPFAGRNVHIGLAQLLAWRLSRSMPNTFSLSINDYGLELLSALPLDPAPLHDGTVFSTENLLHDVLHSLNAGHLAQRRFREIARVAGLVFGGYPGAPKSLKQLQASSGLFYEVFRKYDGANLLLGQAETEVLSQELELARLTNTLSRMCAQPLDWSELRVPSPFCLPLLVERFREQLSTEKLGDRLARILQDAQAELDRPQPPTRPAASRRRTAPR
jgi:ATP-dependent Lhr-like helicase